MLCAIIVYGITPKKELDSLQKKSRILHRRRWSNYYEKFNGFCERRPLQNGFTSLQESHTTQLTGDKYWLFSYGKDKANFDRTFCILGFTKKRPRPQIQKSRRATISMKAGKFMEAWFTYLRRENLVREMKFFNQKLSSRCQFLQYRKIEQLP